MDGHHFIPICDYKLEGDPIAEVCVRPSGGRPLEPLNIQLPLVNGGPAGLGRGRGRGRLTSDSESQRRSPPSETLSFESFNRIASFKVGCDWEFLPSANPNILKLPQRLTNLGYDLNLGFESAKLLNRDPNTGHFVPDCLRGRVMGMNGSSNGDCNGVQNGETEDQHPRVPLDIYMRYFYQMLIDTNYFSTCRVRPQFVASGRSLAGIMQAPFDEEQDWDFLVTKVGGVIFMVYQNSPTAVMRFNLRFANKNNQQELLDQERATFHGLKFRSIVTKDAKDEGSSQEALNEVEKFFRIAETHFAGHKLLLLTKQIDAFESLDQETNNLADVKGSDIEVTSCRFNPQAPPDRQKKLAPWRLMRLWADSVVSGISKVVTGFRLPDGTLDEIIVDHVSDLPRKLAAANLAAMRRPQRVPYDPKTCLIALKNVLNLLYGAKLPNDPSQAYLLRMKPLTQEVQLFKLPNGHHLFLPEQIVNAVQKAYINFEDV